MEETRRRLGATGEAAAADLYVRRGYRIVARNWRCRLGELDLVVSRGGTLVFCEVKTRGGDAFGGGWESVTARKRAKIRSLAQAYLIQSGARPQAVRFDVASVALGPTSRRPPWAERSPLVELFEDAF